MAIDCGRPSVNWISEGNDDMRPRCGLRGVAREVTWEGAGTRKRLPVGNFSAHRQASIYPLSVYGILCPRADRAPSGELEKQHPFPDGLCHKTCHLPFVTLAPPRRRRPARASFTRARST